MEEIRNLGVGARVSIKSGPPRRSTRMLYRGEGIAVSNARPEAVAKPWGYSAAFIADFRKYIHSAASNPGAVQFYSRISIAPRSNPPLDPGPGTQIVPLFLRGFPNSSTATVAPPHAGPVNLR